MNIVGISVATFTSLGDLCLTKHVGNLPCLDDVTLMFKLKTLTDSQMLLVSDLNERKEK